MGFQERNIVSTLERYMKCGVGKCGHCCIGVAYVCVDGPVFTYEQIKKLGRGHLMAGESKTNLREQLECTLRGRVCLMGVGNADYGDDALGVYLAEALVEAGVPDVIVAGNSPERYLGRVADMRPEHVLFLDAVEFGAAPGVGRVSEFPTTHRPLPTNLNSQDFAEYIGHVRRGEWGHESMAARGPTRIAERGTKPYFPGAKNSGRALTTVAARETTRDEPMLNPEQAVLVSILTCMAGAALTLLVARNKLVAGWLAFLVTGGTALLVLSAIFQVLTRGPSPHPAAFWAMPKFGFALRIYVDGLTAVFLLLATLIAVPASFYSILYMRHYRDYSVGRYYPYFLLFLAAMYGLLSTTDMMWFFFIFWQLMTLPGYALIRFENRKPQNVWAANKFLIMMQIACAATMVGAELLAIRRQGCQREREFEVRLRYREREPALAAQRPGPALTALAFGLFLAGFGIKMGMWPFGQFWLPDAHPAAPSPVSAMLSGVMIKTGVYGLMRYFLWLVPARAQADYPLARWGMLVAVLGTITLFTGTMQALKQEQSKRLLAFHSIGQIGYILLGTGTCMALLPANTPATAALATIAFFGALFHVLNHGLFKGLLFLNAGSMLHATGTQDLNQMGGMMKFMPLTAITALVASFSISGVPLFNGFVSKWSIYVAAIQGSRSAKYLSLCAVIAILTSALTLASFIKFFGVSFLSRTSDTGAANARRGDGWKFPG